MAWEQLNRVSVNNGPLAHQDWRASDNFSISPPWPCSKLRWAVIDADCQNARFSVARDVTWGSDYKEFENLASGSTTGVITGGNIYIGGVYAAPHPFTILIEGDRA